MKKLLSLCCLALILSLVSIFFIKRYVEPNQVYFREVSEISDKWAQKLRQESPSIYVVCGGSSGRFGIDPQILHDEFNIPLVTANGNAGFGLMPSVAIAWRFLQEGDTLILSHEDSLIRMIEEPCPNSGLQQAFQLRGPWMFEDGIIPFNWNHLSRTLRGDSQALAKCFAQLTHPVNERYRYFRNAVKQPSGWVKIIEYSNYPQKLVQLAKPSNLHEFDLSPTAREFYQHIQQRCQKKGVHLIYYPPAYYFTPDSEFSRAWLSLQITRLGIPVMKMPHFNFFHDKNHIADSTGHTNELGAGIYTRRMGKVLRDQRFWTEHELIHELNLRGWNEDGSPCPMPQSRYPF